MRPLRAIVLVALLALATGGGLAAALNLRAGSAPAPRSSLHVIGPAPSAQRITFVLLLRLPGAAQLKAALAAIENPRSPRFRQFIDPRAFGARFGISTKQLRVLEQAARASGLQVGTSYPQRTELGVSGTVGTVERLLRVRIVTYGDGAGHRFHAPVGSPVVPAEFARSVDGVSGLDTRPHLHPHDVPMGGLTPPLALTAYDIAALHDAGFSGQGKTIAVVSFSAFDPSDPAHYASSYGLSGPTPQAIPVDGGTTDMSGQDEANLDIEVIRAVAPQAQVLVYEAPQTTSAYADTINRIVADRRAQIISSSWGQCELDVDPAERAADSRALTAAVASGVSMFVASGDQGAYDCQSDDLADHRLSVDWPASSAYTIAVGGTRLYITPDGSYQHEAAWEDQLSDGGGGGGFSTGDARPAWQAGPGVLDSYSNGRRQLPDVSANADPGTPWAFYTQGQSAEVGGTSAATPFWAASMLLIEQYAATQHVGALGFVDPILYALAASPRPYPAFHDVTVGANRFYQAGPGWNPATGLGSPDVYNLARDMVAYLRAHRR